MYSNQNQQLLVSEIHTQTLNQSIKSTGVLKIRSPIKEKSELQHQRKIAKANVIECRAVS